MQTLPGITLCSLSLPLAICLALTAQACKGCEEQPAAGDMSSDKDMPLDMRSVTDMNPPAVEMGEQEDMLVGDLPEDVDLGDPAERECEPGDGAGELALHTVGAWQVHVHPTTGRWRVSGLDGDITAPEGCVEDEEKNLPAVRIALGEPSVRTAFGAYQINAESARMKYRTIAGEVERLEVSEDALAIWWPLLGEDGESAILRFSLHGDGDLRVELDSTMEEMTGGEISLDCVEDEGFFGLGTQVTGMDLRGGTYPLWAQEQGIHKPDSKSGFPLKNIAEAAYAPMGVLHSSRGWAGLVTHDAFTEMDLCEARHDRLVMRSHAGKPGLVFVSGENPRARMTRITEYTGRITEPARWTFGPWNDTVGGPERVAEVTRILRERDIPSSAIWVEDWIGGQLTANGFRLSYAWEWDPNTYPDLPQDIQRLHEDGFAFLGYFNTFVPDTNRMWEEGLQGDFLIKQEDGSVYEFADPAFRNASLIDLSNPAARDWLAGYLEKASRDLGVDGWMADFSEWLPHDAVLANGESGWTYHNRYPIEWQKLNREVFTRVHADDPSRAANDWVFWARSGWASIHGGSAGAAATMWGGDQNTDWGYDDGLPTVVPIGAHVGMAGVAIFGSDIAGYSWIGEGDILSTKELFLRWSSMGAFHPLMRTHQGGAKCLNWSFDRDEETLAHYRRYASIHTLLLPYFEERAREAIEHGWPITRHPHLVFPEERALWSAQEDYQFFLGDAILVAPTMEEGATTRRVYLPESITWWPLLGGQPVDEAGSLEVASPATEIPAYVRGGTALILLGEVVDSFYGASDPEVTDLSDVENHWRVGLYPGSGGEATGSIDKQLAIVASGVTPLIDWSRARIAGELLEPCGVAPTEACHTEDHLVLFGEQVDVSVDGASIAITGVPSGRYDVYVGGDVFGEHAAPTPLLELDSQAPPVCENRKE